MPLLDRRKSLTMCPFI